jgi:hypothetical protein
MSRDSATEFSNRKGQSDQRIRFIAKILNLVTTALGAPRISLLSVAGIALIILWINRNSRAWKVRQILDANPDWRDLYEERDN